MSGVLTTGWAGSFGSPNERAHQLTESRRAENQYPVVLVRLDSNINSKRFGRIIEG